jgi:DNA-binding response OmpR family regulator
MLLVDDLDVNRASLKEIFRLQYDVLEAADGIEALEILEKTPVDIVILDLYMPRMDGKEVLRRMRMQEAWQKIPVLIKTAVDENMEVKLLEMGADDFIISPFDPALIVNRVKNIMQKYIYERRILPDRMERDLSAAVERILACADPLDTRDPDERFADILVEARAMQAVLKQRKNQGPAGDGAGLESIGTDVLLVSSDEVYGEYLSAAFLRCGAKTVSAGNAEQAARECTIAYSAGGFAWYVIDFDME